MRLYLPRMINEVSKSFRYACMSLLFVLSSFLFSSVSIAQVSLLQNELLGTSPYLGNEFSLCTPPSRLNGMH